MSKSWVKVSNMGSMPAATYNHPPCHTQVGRTQRSGCATHCNATGWPCLAGTTCTCTCLQRVKSSYQLLVKVLLLVFVVPVTFCRCLWPAPILPAGTLVWQPKLGVRTAQQLLQATTIV
jgi:hypothetical protein